MRTSARVVLPLAVACSTLLSAGIAACGPVDVTPSSPPAAVAAPSASGPTMASASPPAAAPLTFVHAPDGATLHGVVHGATPVVLPDGSFLLLRGEDMPNGGVLLHSADGLEWVPLEGDVPGTGGTAIRGLAASRDAIVAVGALEEMDGTGPEPPLRTAIWRSRDGLTWDLAHPVVVPGFTADEVTGSPVGFVAQGEPRERLLAGDAGGTRWALVGYPGAAVRGAWLADVTGFDGGFIAVGSSGDNGIAWTSPDGQAWTRLPLLVQGVPLDRVAAVGGRFVATGSRTVVTADDEVSTPFAIASSDGGRTWVDAVIPLDGMADVSAFAVPEGIVAVTTGPRFDSPQGTWLSRDGATWEPITVEDPGIPDEHVLPGRAAWSATRVVVVANTVGTGAGGDRVVVWTYDRAGT